MEKLYIPYYLTEEEATEIAGYKCGVCNKPLPTRKPVILIPARGMTAWTEETELIHLDCAINILSEFEGTDLQKYHELLGATNDTFVKYNRGDRYIILEIRNNVEEVAQFVFNEHGTFIRFRASG